MKKLLLTLVFVTLNAHATEGSNALCELYKAKAELSSSIMSSPYAYGNSNQNNTASLGIAYSLAGRSKAQLEREIAEAKCTSTATTTLLDEQQKWALISIAKLGARAEVTLLLKARELAKEHLNLVEQQLKAQTSTITEYNSSKQILLSIENKISSIKTVLAEPSITVNLDNISDLIAKARDTEGQIAELLAKQESVDAWDVSISAGAQRDLSSNGSSGTDPFVGLSFRWSFGSVGTKDAVNKIRNKAETAFTLNQAGYTKNADRLLEKLKELLTLEKDREALLVDVIADNQRILESFSHIDTALAKVTKTALNVQTLIYRAELAGVRVRIDKYSGIKN